MDLLRKVKQKYFPLIEHLTNTKNNLKNIFS